MYGQATGAQSAQNGPFWAPWPRPRFFSFLNFFNGRNGPSIPQNDRKWVRNLNPEPCWDTSYHIWEISIFVRFWVPSRNGPFLTYAWEFGLDIRRPNSPHIGLLGHQNWLVGNYRGRSYWGKRTVVLYTILFTTPTVAQYIPMNKSHKDSLKNIIFIHKKFIFYYIRGHKGL